MLKKGKNVHRTEVIDKKGKPRILLKIRQTEKRTDRKIIRKFTL